jgi:hypothetical protein
LIYFDFFDWVILIPKFYLGFCNISGLGPITLPAGVYVAMNGKYFHADKVKKNKQRGVFESK